jgi:TorA maturation chaperone TorD
MTPVDVALCRSALWEALALGFRRPTEETMARLASPEGAGHLAAAASLLDDAVDGGARQAIGGGCPAIGAGQADAASGGGGPGEDGRLAPAVLALASKRALADLRAGYDRLFGHTARGAVPPYETEYGEDSAFLPQREMSDLAAFFRAFGLALRADARERPDHIACQCEFMLVLARKEAHAEEVGDAAMGDATRRAARLFLRDHLGRWAPGFGRKLAREDPGGFHGALGCLCALFVAAECRRAAVPTGPALLRLRSAEVGDVPMACGTAAEGCPA